MKPADRQFLDGNAWLRFLDGDRPGYPEQVLRRDLGEIRSRIAAMRQDTTTPDTRLADDSMKYNPASVAALRELMLGGIDPGRRASVLHCRLRYFDPLRRRAGIPADCAALVDRLTADEVRVTLVNTNQLEPRRLLVQSGAYAEHTIQSVTVGGSTTAVGEPNLEVRLAPGAGATLTLKIKRYSRQPTMVFPWDRG